MRIFPDGTAESSETPLNPISFDERMWKLINNVLGWDTQGGRVSYPEGYIFYDIGFYTYAMACGHLCEGFAPATENCCVCSRYGVARECLVCSERERMQEVE